MSNLSHIVYVSTAKGLLSEQQLRHILDDARAFNAAHDVTGVLLYTEGSFFQYFEGPVTSVAEVIERIEHSTSHSGIIKLHIGELSERLFSGWLMGFSPATNLDVRALCDATWQRQVVAQAAEPPSGWVLLQSFCKANRISI